MTAHDTQAAPGLDTVQRIRRQLAAESLEAAPAGVVYSWRADPDADGLTLTVAVRGVATAQLFIEALDYDVGRLLELIASMDAVGGRA